MEQHCNHYDFGGGHLIEDYSLHHSPPNDYEDFDFSTFTQRIQPYFPTRQPSDSLMPSHDPILPETDPRRTPAQIPSKILHSRPTSRKALTNSDRLRMRKYHIDNPKAKQTEIGAKFGVERSTVSKILGNQRYLLPEEGNRSPIRTSNSKFPDIERTLTCWAKNRLNEGLPLDDNTIKDQARKFAAAVDSTEYHAKANNPVWLENSKTKNHLPGARSLEEEPDSSDSGSKTQNGISPIEWGDLPISSVKDESESQSLKCYMVGYGYPYSESTASLNSCFSEMFSVASDFRSPTSSFFPPMSSCAPGPLSPASKMARLPPLTPTSSLGRRQTAPLIGAETSLDSATSKYSPRYLAPSTIESPLEEMEVSPLSATKTAHTGITNYSPLLMAPPPSISPNTIAITNTSPSIGSVYPSSSAPSQDEARAALFTLMEFIEHQPNGAVDPHDYLVMGKWMQRLKLETSELPGGMQATSMARRADGTLPIGGKRGEHALS